MSPRFSIIIPTKNRASALADLFASLKGLKGLAELRPEIIVADNDSQDETPAVVERATRDLPADVKRITTIRPGKSAALNDALKVATGDYLAFLDDDVVADSGWLRAIDQYFLENDYRVGQGKIGLSRSDTEDPVVCRLVDKFRTIPQLSFLGNVTQVQSLNGANFFIARKVLLQVGGFDERLGPGASGTSEDVELARRLRAAGVRIGYARDCLVFHRVDRDRLTESYFAEIHRRQGRSRLLIKNRGYPEILLSAARAYVQYGLYSVIGPERRRYRSKGRIYHYLSMLEAKRKGSSAGRS